MARLIFCHGDKGGVGKSTLTRSLIDFYASRKEEIDIYDTDKRNSDLQRFFEKSRNVDILNMTSESAFDVVLNNIHERKRTAIIDLAAGAGESLYTLITGAARLADTLTTLKARATIIYVLSRSRSSVAGLQTCLKDFADVPADFVIAKNLYFGAADKFTRYDKSNTRKEAATRKAIEIAMPELLDDLYDEIDTAGQSPAALLSGSTLQFMQRQRLTNFVSDITSEFEKAVAYL